MATEIQRIDINETKIPELQKCASCSCKMLLSYFDFNKNTGQLKKTCRKCLERNKIAKDLVKYGNSVIYKICCKDESITDCYVGSTVDFGGRKRDHKHKCNNVKSTQYNYPVYRFIRDNGNFDNWNFEILENYPCRNKESLVKKERFWFEKLGAKLNSQYPQRSLKEYYQDNKEQFLEQRKQYYKENKEEMSMKMKKYRKNNSEKIKEKKKDYYNKNSEKIKEKTREKVECPCGSVVTKVNLSTHKKSQKHQNWEKTLS
jgi:hypothetical protein